MTIAELGESLIGTYPGPYGDTEWLGAAGMRGGEPVGPEWLSDFKILTFDCYGTLIDWETGILNELKPWAARHGLRLDDETLLKAFAEEEAACERETPKKLYPQILESVLERLAERWSVKPEEEEAPEFGRSVGKWPAFPDSAEALSYLQEHYKLVILSNVDRDSFALSELRLGVKFDRVITAQDVGSYKPDVRNFHYMLEDLQGTLRAGPDVILHTAQSLFHDIVPARSVGLTTMWINRRKESAGWGATPPVEGEGAVPDLEVASMAEFVALHEALA